MPHQSASAHDLTGTWRIALPRRGGATIVTYLIFHGADTAFDGTVIINDAVEIPMRRPHFEQGEGCFSIDWNADYRVRREDDRLRVIISPHRGDSEETLADRVPAELTRPVAPAPLPAFVPLPPNGLALSPPMGWSSWNHFADRVDDRVIRETADAMVASGLAAAGYQYVNIDDAWAAGRNAAGEIIPNGKFPDMKALADYVHARGLKIGIYSSPGPRTCGGYEGSYGHEEQDARTFAAWGMDFLKHDWCSAVRIYGQSAGNLRASYLKMGRALAACGRPIVYSLCEYGYGRVWEWGASAGGNLWRTTNDIQDTWESMSAIGFSQHPHARWAGPGRWNDPDMLEVGNGGMTTEEYRTHFSLWCLLAAPLIAGNDLRNMSADTLAILSNPEAIAVDQDPLGRPAQRITVRDNVEIWSRPLQDGAFAIGIFNRGDLPARDRITWPELGLTAAPVVLRDLWLHKNLAPEASGFATNIPAHGCVLLRARATPPNSSTPPPT